MKHRELIERLLENSNYEGKKVENYGLLNGKAGLCLYYYVTGRNLKSPEHTQKGHQLLDELYQGLTPQIPLDIPNGLAGIVLALSYLIRNGYSTGNINVVAKNIDCHIYRTICNAMDMDMKDKAAVPMIDIFLYVNLRYRDMEDEDERWIMRRLMIELMNYIYINRPETFFLEPLPFSMQYPLCEYIWALVQMHRMGIERRRINFILREMHYIVFAQRPMLQANRLLLAYVAALVADELDLPEWKEFADSLCGSIDIKHILYKEMNDKNIFAPNGVIAVYLLIQAYNRLLEEKLFCDEHELLHRIEKSSAWERASREKEYFEKHRSLQGFCGTILFMDYLKNRTR